MQMLKQEASKLSKMEQICKGKHERKEYLTKLPYKEATTILKARVRMLPVKTNFKQMYTDTKCDRCGDEQEDERHVLERCTAEGRPSNITFEQILQDDTETDTLSAAAVYFNNIFSTKFKY